MLAEFKKFIMRGSMLDLAIGIIIGTAFGSIIKSLVDDIIMPPIGLLLGKVDFSNLFILLKAGNTPAPYASLADAKTAGAVTMNYGLFINLFITFLIVALVCFLIIRAVNKLEAGKKTKEAPAVATKDCPFCLEKIAIKAKRCPHCTSQLS